MRKWNGFTLIELLVVIAIIALIAAILFPVFASAREKSRQSACASNERQICLALLAYSQDYDERFPMCWTCESNSNAVPTVVKWTTWVGLMTPYETIGDAYNGRSLILQCPDDIVRPGGGFRSYALAGATDASSTSYSNSASYVGVAGDGFAGPIAAGVGGWIYQTGHLESDLPNPASLLMVVEVPGSADLSEQADAVCMRPDTAPSASDYTTACDTSGGDCGQDFRTTTVPNPFPTGFNPVVAGYHTGGWNYGFADGHVKWMRPEQTVSAAYAKSWNNWGNVNPHGLWSLTPTN